MVVIDMKEKYKLLIEHKLKDRTVTIFQRGDKGGYVLVDSNEEEYNNKIYLNYNVAIESFNQLINKGEQV
jgi:hypothetical protein